MLVSLLATRLMLASAGPPLPAWRVAIDDSLTSGFVGERWGSTDTCKAFGLDGFKVQGNNRAYAIQAFPDQTGDWGTFEYLRMPLLNRALQFEVDLSKVGCGCNAAVYLVKMPERPNEYTSAYCDIAGVGGSEACLEIDMVEGNAKALQATLHTTTARGWDGRSCNADGCAANVGKTEESQRLFGPAPGPHGINSSKPFTVTATFRTADGGTVYDVALTQDGGRSLHFFDSEGVAGGSHVMGNKPTPVPAADRARMHAALEEGMVLVISLWSSDDLAWLDGGCDDWVAKGRPKCTPENLWGASMIISGMRTSSVPSPPAPPPPPGAPPSPPPLAPPASILGASSVFVLYALAFILTLIATVYHLRMRALRKAAEPPLEWPGDRAIRRVRQPVDDDMEDEDDLPVRRSSRRGVSRI